MSPRCFPLLLLIASPLLAATVPVTKRAIRPAEPGLTDREAMRLAPPAPWRSRGWRTVFPHAYAMQRRVAVRPTPELSARPAFELTGGMRVPIYEQRGAWWRIGGTKARTGWVRANEMAPHARCIMLDARTGRVLRQFATKGQWSVLPRPDALWALADTGLTRVAWDGGPHFWSNTTHSDADASITRDAAWSLDGQQAAVVRGNQPNHVQVFSLADGAPLGDLAEASSVRLVSLGGYPHLFAFLRDDGGVPDTLFDPFQKQRIVPPAGRFFGFTKAGDALIGTPGDRSPSAPSEWRELLRQERVGHVAARWKHRHPLLSVVPSPDDQYLLATERLNDASRLHATLLDARKLRPVLTLKMPVGEAPKALFHSRSGWMVLTTGIEAEEDFSLTRWDARGRFLSKRAIGQAWTATAAGDAIYLSSEHGLERRDLKSGARQKFPLAWSRPLLKRNLRGVMNGTPHWEITHLNLTPDQKTLIVLERLAGDREG